MAPFGIGYRTHGTQFNTDTDHEFFITDPTIIMKTKGVIVNVIELMRLDIERQLKGKIVPVCE